MHDRWMNVSKDVLHKLCSNVLSDFSIPALVWIVQKLDYSSFQQDLSLLQSSVQTFEEGFVTETKKLRKYLLAIEISFILLLHFQETQKIRSKNLKAVVSQIISRMATAYQNKKEVSFSDESLHLSNCNHMIQIHAFSYIIERSMFYF